MSAIALTAIGTILVIGAGILLSLNNQRKALRSAMKTIWPEEKNQKYILPTDPRESGVLYVHCPPLRPWGFPNASPFSLKLETWLHLHRIDYTVVRGFDTKNAPKGKIPWIELNGKKVGDSELIIQFLKKTYDIPTENLTAAETGVSHAFKNMACEHLASFIGYARNYEFSEETLKQYTGLEKLPFMLKMVAKKIVKGTKSKLDARGLLAHSRDEVYEMGLEDMRAIAQYLGTKQFFHGDVPTEVDVSLFAMLASIAWVPFHDWPLKKAFFNDPELVHLQDYLKRVKSVSWGETDSPWYMGEGH